MSKQPDNKLRRSFKEGQLTKLAEQLQWRDWTAALLEQRIAELQEKLAAGDIPILDGVSANNQASMPDPVSAQHRQTVDEPLEDDVFSPFLEG